MAELVDDVLFLSELETGRAVVALGDVRVPPIVDEVVAALRPSAERHAQELVTLVADDVYVAVRPRMLRVLVENLLTNAIRYAGDGARITVSARTEGDVVLLSVADNGRGVPTAELPRLFERFFRGDRARTTHGTGLGLAIVKHVVTQAGGEVEARPGTGRPRARGSLHLPPLSPSYCAAAMARISLVPQRREFYDLYNKRGDEQRRDRAAARAAPRRVPERPRHARARHQGGRARGRPPDARGRRSAEPHVRDAVRPRRHVPPRERARRHLRSRRRGDREHPRLRRHRDPAEARGSRRR